MPLHRPFITFLDGTAAVGRSALVAGRILGGIPRLHPKELSRSLVHFGYDTLPLALVVAAVVGTTGVLQTMLYVQRFGARGLLGWAGGYAVLWEFGPLVLGLLLAARVGARNAAELATLQVGGQLEGLAGVALDPYALLLAPRAVAMVFASLCLAAVSFVVAILFEVFAAFVLLRIPGAAFVQSVAGMLGPTDIAAGMIKVTVFAAASALISCSAGIAARGGARAVGDATAASVVRSAAAIFVLDFALTSLLERWFL